MNHGVDTSFLVAAELQEHEQHGAVRSLIKTTVLAGDRFSLAPQVLAEFIHVATDQKRLQAPLDIDTARRIAFEWWTAREVDQTFPNSAAIIDFLSWLQRHRLGRKRLLDTMLAATYWHSGVRSIATLNPTDFSLFPGIVSLLPAGSQG